MDTFFCFDIFKNSRSDPYALMLLDNNASTHDGFNPLATITICILTIITVLSISLFMIPRCFPASIPARPRSELETRMNPGDIENSPRDAGT